MDIHIIVKTSTMREKLECLNVNSTKIEDIFDAIKRTLNEHGYKNLDNLFCLENNQFLTEENIDSCLIDNKLFVVCNLIVSPYGAVRIDKVNGITYFCRPSETPHLKYPHVHAEYQGETIYVNLKKLEITGRFKNKTKMKEARLYVLKNKEEILKTWNELFN